MDRIPNRWLVMVPLVAPLTIWCQLVGNPLLLTNHWQSLFFHNGSSTSGTNDSATMFAVQQQLMAYMLIAVLGYGATQRLVPHIQQYTLRKNICGKDLGKRGTATADVPMYVLVGSLEFEV
jgi:hypothetical protein